MGLALGVSPAGAQQVIHSQGRLVRVATGATKDTVGVPGVQVVLHRIGRQQQGPIDSTLSRRSGRFQFRFALDTSAIFLVSARFAGIEYFSQALTADSTHPLTNFQIVVADTSSTAPVRVAERHVVIQEPDPSGIRSVLDLIVLENPGPLTRVATDSTRPVFEVSVPDRATSVGVTPQSEFSEDAIVVTPGAIELLAPLAPGTKQIMVQYDLPARPGIVSLWLPAVPTLNLLLVEPKVVIEGVSVALVDSQVIDGTLFRRFGGTVPDSGAMLRLGFQDGPAPRTLGLILLSLTLLAFGGFAVLLVRRSSARVAPQSTRTLVEALAALDDRYEGLREKCSPEEWDRYLVERARMKADLRRRLAGVRPGA